MLSTKDSMEGGLEPMMAVGFRVLGVMGFSVFGCRVLGFRASGFI